MPGITRIHVNNSSVGDTKPSIKNITVTGSEKSDDNIAVMALKKNNSSPVNLSVEDPGGEENRAVAWNQTGGNSFTSTAGGNSDTSIAEARNGNATAVDNGGAHNQVISGASGDGNVARVELSDTSKSRAVLQHSDGASASIGLKSKTTDTKIESDSFKTMNIDSVEGFNLDFDIAPKPENDLQTDN